MYCIASHHRLMREEPKEGIKILHSTNRGKAVETWHTSFENDTECYVDNEARNKESNCP